MLVLTRKTRKRVVVENPWQSESTSLHSRSQPVDKSRSTGHPAPLATCPGADAMPDLQNLFTQYRGCPSKINFDAFVNELANRPDILRSIRRHASDPRTAQDIADGYGNDHLLAESVAWAFVDRESPTEPKITFYDSDAEFARFIGFALRDWLRKDFGYRKGIRKEGGRQERIEDTHDDDAYVQREATDHGLATDRDRVLQIINHNYGKFVLDQLERETSDPMNKLIWSSRELEGCLSESDWKHLVSAAFPYDDDSDRVTSIVDFLTKPRPNNWEGDFAEQHLAINRKNFSKRFHRVDNKLGGVKQAALSKLRTKIKEADL